ncbi:MAG: sulfatase-like hydrolase/transferase, partial [Anaerolineales bacterium]
RDFLRWLDRQEERPFFAFLNYFDAHAPYLPPEPYDTKFGPARPQNVPVFIEGIDAWTGSEEQLQYEIDAYDGAIAHLDEQIGNLLEELKQRGRLENTLVVITSDHGEEFREHGVMSHGNSLYRQTVEVPLLMIFPGKIPSGVVVEEPVSLRNIPMTVAQLTNLDPALQFPGVSLTQYWDSELALNLEPDPLLSEVHQNASQPSWYPIANGDMFSAVIGEVRIIKNGDGEIEMYDFFNDPLEKNRLSYGDLELSDKLIPFSDYLDVQP